jgi:hypothetical protein
MLSKLDLKSLTALFEASRVYRMQLSINCKSVLFKCFMNMLTVAALDAQMGFHSSTKAFLGARSPETVDRFLRS